MTINVLLIHPDGRVEDREVEPELDTFRGLLDGGWLEGVSLEQGAAYADEEGRMKGLPVNEVATVLAQRLGWPGDFLVGPVVFFGADAEGNETSYPDRFKRELDAIAG